MLSTINWTNQGSGPGNDTDSFDATFGVNAAQARLIVTRAISDWEEVILNFNHSGGGNVYSLTINTGMLTGARAQGQWSTIDADKVPTSGAITLDDDAGGAGWYFDSVIADDAEFDTTLGPFSAEGSITGNDLYRTIAHEIGHAIGVDNDPALRLAQFLTNLNVDDPVANDVSDPGGLWAFNVHGGPIEATFTAADAGHLYEGPAIANRSDIPIHPNELMNSGRGTANNNRKLITDLDASMLRDAYGYTVAMPSTLNNMYVNPSFTTDVLSIEGSEGSDSVVVQRTAFPGALLVNVNGYSEVVPLSQVASIDIDTSFGGDDVHLIDNAGRSTTVEGNLGGDKLFITPQTAATLKTRTVASSAIGTVTYYGVEQVFVDGSAGNDSFTVESTGDAFISVRGNDGDDTLFITPNSQNFAAYGESISWNGGDDRDTLRFDNQTINLDTNYGVRRASVSVSAGAQSVFIQQVGFDYFFDSVVVNAGNGYDVISLLETNLRGTFSGGVGNDSFVVGGGNVGAGYSDATLIGGSGNDTLVLDDSFYAGAANWVVNDVNVQRNIPGSAQLFGYGGFEGVGIKTGVGGSTANNITTFGAIPVSLTVTGGPGRDHFFLNNFANEAGGGPSGPEQLQSLFDGGGGFNQLIVDDTARGILTYNMYPTRLEINEVLADDGSFSFAGMNAISITASDSFTTFNVYGTPATIDSGNQTTVFLRGGNDIANVFPHDSAGRLTMASNIGIIGEGGTDTLNIQDAASADPINYSFANPFGAGTQNISGLGAGGLGTATVENLNVNAGGGADVFDVNQFASGAALTLNGGFGDDTLNFGNNNLAGNITSLASFLFNGQDGVDLFNLRNAASVDSYTYAAASNTNIQASRTFPTPYFLTLDHFNVELRAIYAGSAQDILNITTHVSGDVLDFYGAGGDDAVNLPVSSDSIGRRFNFFGGDGTANRINQINNTKIEPSILHIDQTTIGAFPGDSFFGPGGSIYFESVQILQLRMGSGEDAAYVQPNAAATISINGANPTTAPGDTLNLALATAVNYIVTPTSATAGNVTSDNLQRLTYSGFETGPVVDDVAPSIVSQNYDDVVVPTMLVEFSEDVSATLSVGYLNLINDITGERIAFELMALNYDVGTNIASFTFPGYPDGVLPPGNYTATIAATLTDSFGNALVTETPFSFQVIGTASADFDGDGDADGADFLAWQRGLGILSPDGTKTDGDADNDGDVDGDDLAVWRNQFESGVAIFANAIAAAVVSAAEPTLTLGSALSAELVDLAIGEESGRYPTGQTLRNHALAGQNILSDDASRPVPHYFDGALDLHVAVQPPLSGPCRELSREVESSTLGFFEDQLDAIDLD
ncbi:MAG: hypothetical protein H0T51_00145, partial [Pirellulales bacterium]|nr:hypothetical protein [Pirellulales bacterium]